MSKILDLQLPVLELKKDISSFAVHDSIYKAIKVEKWNVDQQISKFGLNLKVSGHKKSQDSSEDCFVSQSDDEISMIT